MCEHVTLSTIEVTVSLKVWPQRQLPNCQNPIQIQLWERNPLNLGRESSLKRKREGDFLGETEET